MANWMRSARLWAVTAALCTMVTVVGCGEPAANKPADTKPGTTTTPATPDKPATATTPESGSTTKPKAGGGVDVPEEKK